MLELNNLGVTYSNRLVLEGVNLTFQPSTITGIIGPNGAGKSSLLKAILNIIDYQGSVLLDHKPLENPSKRLAYMEQKSGIDINFPITVRECVSLGLYSKLNFFHRLNKKDWQEVDQALESVNLKGFAQRQISQLSGGEFQRMLIARCLVQDSDYLLLDEPFVGVDIISEEIIVRLLKKLKEKGKTILIVHHDLSKVTYYFDHVLLLNQKVIDFGKVSHVFTRDKINKTYGSVFGGDL